MDRVIPSITNTMLLERPTLLNPRALVMKGGGVKGLAHVGALRVLQRYYHFDWFVGTSAGAIAAAFLAAGFTVDELEDVLKQKNFADFLDSKRRWLLYNLITTGGLYPGVVFKRWVSNKVNEKLQSPAAVKLNHDPNLPGVKLKHRVTIYASTAGQKALAFDSLSPTSAEVDLAYAVRCSMSIPFLFAPQSFNGAVTLDGGIQNNFPVGALLKDHPDTKFVGLYLGPEVNLEQETQPHPILGPLLTQVRALLSIVLDAADRQALLVHRDNTVIIDTRPIGTIDFHLSDEEKDFLLKVGQAAALKFLITKNYIDGPTETELESAERDVIQARDRAERMRRTRRKKLKTKLFVAAFVFVFLMVWSTAAVVRLVRTYLRTSDQVSSPLLQEKPLTTLKGSEHNPTFSPDGSLVAFSWDGGTRGNSAIYVQPLSGTIPSSPLTHGNGSDFSPTWSPDGQLIAFVRNPGEHGSVFVVAPTGGTEERVTDLNGTAIAWFPDKGHSDRLVLLDGRYRADGYGLYSVDLTTKQKRFLKSLPINKGIGCSDQIAFSPDGEYVAYISNCDLWVAPVHHSDSDTEIGEPFRLTIETRELNGFAWLPNSQEIVYSAKPETSIALLRISVAAGSKPKVIENFGQGATNPSISHLANGSTRLVFEKASSSANIVRTNLTVGAERTETESSVSLTVDDEYICSAAKLDLRPCLIAPSTQADLNPKFSPNGQRIVFASTRSGSWEIYLCNGDGSAIQQVTRLKAFTGSPRWSPDGKRIAFDSTVDDNLNLFKRSTYNREIFWMDVDGGKIHRLTNSSSEEARPSWSRDGEWIYFMSNRTGRPEIWKTRVTTGETLQITRNGGFEAYESFDSKLIYYVKSHEAKGVWQIPVNGGDEKLFWDAVREGVWDLSRTGIYFIDYESASSGGFKNLRFINFDTKEINELGRIRSGANEHPIGLSVSEDQKIILLVQQGAVYSDLFYIEGSLFN